jgi:hypothetical protein
MFDTHQKTIGEFARANPENMFRVITFVHATVQQSLNTVPAIMRDTKQRGAKSIHLWGWKRGAFEFFETNRADVYRQAMAIYDNYPDPDTAAHELLKYFAALPGLGMVKGGFVIQLCFGLSGCIDRHNLARFSIPEAQFAAGRFKGAKTNATRNKLVANYHATVARCGGTAALWNDWCDYVAAKNTAIYANGEAVSALHVSAIKAA